jgi:tetratricopeptide (TPR) repeat protein
MTSLRGTDRRWRWTRVALGLAVAGALGAGAAGPARGDGGGGGGADAPAGQPRDAAYGQAVQAIEKGDYPRAVALLDGLVKREPANADAWNQLAYATRQSGHPDRSIPLYQKALAIDPGHRGAHEYIGEAYLALGDLPRAREHLARLDKLCFLPCSEHRDLKKAVEAFERSGGKVRPAARRAN